MGTGHRDGDRATWMRCRDWGMLFFSSSTITPKRAKAVPVRRFPYRYLGKSHLCHHRPTSPSPSVLLTATQCHHAVLGCPHPHTHTWL